MRPASALLAAGAACAVVYPLVWILLIPFRIVGTAVGGVLGLLRAVVTLPARMVSGPRAL